MSEGVSTSVTARDDAMSVLNRLREAGHIAYFAGGCVRDMLLGQSPEDYDVATDAPPARVRELFKNTQAVGAAFGVVLVRQRKSMIEVATFRTDLEYSDGRRPDGVKFSSPEEDAQRRDFTINGLFLDPVADRVIDYVGGQADIVARRIRAIGNADDRFAEDHLRILRAVRFAARFGFEIEAHTASAIVRHAHQLPRISPERIGEELRKMLSPASRMLAWQLLWELNLVQQVFRFVPVPSHQQLDAERSIFLSLEQQSSISIGHALAGAVLDYVWQNAGRGGDITPWLKKREIDQFARAVRQSLKISNEESDEMTGTLAGVASLLVGAEPSVALKKRLLDTPTQKQTRSLLTALQNVGILSQRILPLLGELAELSRTDFAPPPLITGDDLIALGATPGPRFKLALDATYDAQLENRIADREQAIEMARKVLTGGN